jgi:hypothetical protein
MAVPEAAPAAAQPGDRQPEDGALRLAALVRDYRVATPVPCPVTVVRPDHWDGPHDLGWGKVVSGEVDVIDSSRIGELVAQDGDPADALARLIGAAALAGR